MRKAALVIGNAAYPTSPLVNPANDAMDMATALRLLNFDVTVLENSTNCEAHTALHDFCASLANVDVALFFYAGHGLQIKGENFLTGIDTDVRTEIAAKHSSLALNEVIDLFEEADNATNIIILDACRTNPFARAWRSASVEGLAPVYAPKGTIIAFATSPGQTASDGEGRNGAYTGAFLQHLRAQDISIETLFKRVRNTVSVSTAGEQTSWEHTSLMGEFQFCPSVSTSERLLIYSPQALADSRFVPNMGHPIGDIIRRLKSRTWDTQNAGISGMNASIFKSATRDDLFVLGRNIYQAACGTAHRAVTFLENMPGSLCATSLIANQHFVDGMLYEIYFDSTGAFRDRLKSDQLNLVFRLEDTPDFTPCFEFIRAAIAPYAHRLFYLPGSKRQIDMDARAEDIGGEQKVVWQIYFEQTNVLLGVDGIAGIDPSFGNFPSQKSVTELQAELSEKAGVPFNRFNLAVAGLRTPDEPFNFPRHYSLRRNAP